MRFDMPTVTVIIPTFNRSELVKQAINSVLAQTHKDFELLVIDDGSTDNTRQVVSAISDSRIKYTYKDNGGVSSARNLGLKNASGEFVAFLDHDDYYPENFLEALIKKLEENPDYGMAYGPITLVTQEEKQIPLYKADSCKSGWVTEDMFKKGFVWTSSAVFRKSVWDGIWYDENLKKSTEDFDAYLRLSTRCRFLYVPQITTYHRGLPDSLSNTKGITCSKPLVLERFYFNLGGNKYISKKVAYKKISHSWRKVARLYYKAGYRQAAITTYIKAIKYRPVDIRLYPVLLKACFLNKMFSLMKQKWISFFLWEKLVLFLYRGILFNLVGRKTSGLLLDNIVSFFVRTPHNKSVLILRFDVIGDFILWLDQAKAYREIFPNQRIILFGHKRWSDFAKTFPYWDEVWKFDPGKFVNDPSFRISTISKVRRAGFETVIQPTHIRFFYADAIVRASGAKERIGSEGDSRHLRQIQQKRCSKWYTKLIPATNDRLMMLCREAEFTRGLGKHKSKAQVPKIAEYFGPISLIKQLPKKYYLLFVGSGAKYKRWPIDKFSKIASLIHSNFQLKGVICGTKGERKLAEICIHTSDADLSDFTGKTSLKELCSIIKYAQFVISNDSCAVHIAAAVGTRSVCILGCSEFGRCLPYSVEQGNQDFFPEVCFCKMDCFGCAWDKRKRICISEKNKTNSVLACINNVDVNQVFNRIKDILDKIPMEN